MSIIALSGIEPNRVGAGWEDAMSERRPRGQTETRRP